ncbi:YceI family protein [Variovorax terrae]|uniref:YceI family protein n=1 Tax=Variovorax terrae TaxID=2923278 RepID=A0A9X2AS32_9BURK|nr:YceI family protein [Variovorax terrae]MCJ0766147.1 YceI family protein [Variovorax terrae]
MTFARSLFTIAFLGANTAWAASQTYVLDPQHSFPHFSISHLDMSTIHGRFDKMSGKVVYDAAARTGAIDVKIATASVTTGDGARSDGSRSRDDHLRSADFFNAAEFPEMHYKSSKLNFNGDRLESVDGTLTLLGVSKPVRMQVTHFKCGPNPFSKKAMCGADAEATVKRTDFGMRFGVPAIADEVKLQINLEAYPE